MEELKLYFNTKWAKKAAVKLLFFVIVAVIASTVCNAFVPVINNEFAMMQMENTAYSSAAAMITTSLLNATLGFVVFGVFIVMFGKDILSGITLGYKAIEEMDKR